MNGRERFEAIYRGERPDRLPILGIGAWGGTLERWRREGLGPDESPSIVLGLDGSDEATHLPLSLSMVPRFPIRVLEEDETYVILVDEYGVTKKMLRVEFERSEGRMDASGMVDTMSNWIDFPVKDMASWKPIFEERFHPDLDGRLPVDWDLEQFIERSKTRWVAFFSYPFGGLFGGLRELMGLENMLFTMADDPHLIHTIIDDLTSFWIETFATILKTCRLDRIMFFEDACGTRGPIISPATYRAFFSPGYRKVTEALRGMGVKEFCIDSDGNAVPMIPVWQDCGMTAISPCQVNAGMDATRLRERFPSFNLRGGIDKRALAQGPEAIDIELRRRLYTAWTLGRYVPTLDHGAPPDISWANAKHFAKRYLEHCHTPPE